MGYRVQVFAAREGPLAEGFADRLRERLPDDPVYVGWEEPWHKVRAGDFTSREEAERLRALLIDMGFVEAWTVRTAIRGR
ncbi:MAG: SPOR domain-containing protein [Gemmatimonadetes bacterium]|nr:SPOR domain-containing protein [Gemmatimonadota bacterium]